MGNDLSYITDVRLVGEILKYTGCRSPERVSVAVASHFGGAAGLVGASARELRAIRGVDRDTARLLRLIGEICGRVIAGSEAHSTVQGLARAAELLTPRLRGLENEALCCLCLDKLWRPADCTLISEGSLTQLVPDSYTIYRTARSAGSHALILAHNHPPDLPDPSVEDIRLTQKLADALKKVSVTLVDHIIFSGEKYVSLAESGCLPPDPLREAYLAGTAGKMQA